MIGLTGWLLLPRRVPQVVLQLGAEHPLQDPLLHLPEQRLELRRRPGFMDACLRRLYFLRL
jgi:hypothetical protein